MVDVDERALRTVVLSNAATRLGQPIGGPSIAGRRVFFAQVEHRLVLLAVAPGVKISAERTVRARDRQAERADLVELPKATLQRGPARHGVQKTARGGVLRLGPLLHLRRVAVLEPCKRVGGGLRAHGPRD
ncbi:MAG TPA: hypothetical protein VFG23_24730 [Polyangia bacterium]|nr:hypothetical protein [Polyangia bacterium]